MAVSRHTCLRRPCKMATLPHYPGPDLRHWLHHNWRQMFCAWLTFWVFFMCTLSPVLPEVIYRVDPLGKYFTWIYTHIYKYIPTTTSYTQTRVQHMYTNNKQTHIHTYCFVENIFTQCYLCASFFKYSPLVPIIIVFVLSVRRFKLLSWYEALLGTNTKHNVFSFLFSICLLWHNNKTKSPMDPPPCWHGAQQLWQNRQTGSRLWANTQ